MREVIMYCDIQVSGERDLEEQNEDRTTARSQNVQWREYSRVCTVAVPCQQWYMKRSLQRKDN